MEIHLDPLGGLSGDMIAAALLDAFPEHWSAVAEAMGGLGLGDAAACRLVPHRDHAGLTGRRFLVAAETGHADHVHDGPEQSAPDAHHHDDDHHHHDHHQHFHHHRDHHHHHEGEPAPHRHRAWRDIRRLLSVAPLDPKTLDHALAIFGLLAEAEGAVHGVSPEDVTFHEVGAVDSIVDIVAAAELVTRISASAWTSAPLPLGSGRVRTQHGLLPVPAPATAWLLRGLPVIDDGIPGERVTPTGAAIARYLLGGASRAEAPRRLARSGTGFGSRVLPGLSNCLRVLAFEPAEAEGAGAGGAFAHRELGVVTFEVDDQSAEDLSMGLDHIRAMAGVHDVVQGVVFGKKGRLATQVQVLVAPDRLDAAIEACFLETTTIGLRFHIVRGAALRREADEVEVEGRRLRVKRVTRPGGAVTAKVEASDVAAIAEHRTRSVLRQGGAIRALGAAARPQGSGEGQ